LDNKRKCQKCTQRADIALCSKSAIINLIPGAVRYYCNHCFYNVVDSKPIDLEKFEELFR